MIRSISHNDFLPKVILYGACYDSTGIYITWIDMDYIVFIFWIWIRI